MTAEIYQFRPRIAPVPTLTESAETKAAAFLDRAPALVIGDKFQFDTSPSELDTTKDPE